MKHRDVILADLKQNIQDMRRTSQIVSTGLIMALGALEKVTGQKPILVADPEIEAQIAKAWVLSISRGKDGRWEIKTLAREELGEPSRLVGIDGQSLSNN